MGNRESHDSVVEENRLIYAQINEEHENLKQKWHSISNMMK